LKDNYGYETGSSSVHERENKKPILKLIQKGKGRKKKKEKKGKEKTNKRN